MIVAKPVVDNQFWILQENDRKIGNIEATNEGFAVKIDNTITSFKTLNMIKQRVNIAFEPVGNKPTKTTAAYNVHGYPSGSKAHNPIWDVKHRLPLFTKDNKSKSWFAAGWYKVKQRKTWDVVQSPKLITLQRYPYHGPFHTREEANDKSVS